MGTTRNRGALFILLCIVLPATLALCVKRGEEAEMPHGQRDWSNTGATEVVHGMDDMAELAARLGSPNVFNREGNVLMLETFEHGATRWQLIPAGTNAAIVVSALRFRTGGYSLKLDSGTGTLHYAFASHSFPFPSLGKFGAELSFSFDDEVTYIDPELWVYDGDNLYLFGLRYDVAGNVLQKRTGTETWVPIVEDFSLYPSVRLWNYMKFVVDLNTGYFLRLIVNEIEYDISDEQGYVEPVEDPARMHFRVTVRGSSGTAGIVYMDDVIITRGEP